MSTPFNYDVYTFAISIFICFFTLSVISTMDSGEAKPVFIKKKMSMEGSLPPSIPLVRAGRCVESVNGTRLQLQIVEESVELIRSIGKPVAPVAICGPYRTGKSYFLSRVLDDLQCFKVGHSTETCTRGIWMATSILECNDFVIIFLDTEGMSAIDGSMQASIDFLITTTLASSMLIYNTMKPLQIKDIEKLRYGSCYVCIVRPSLLFRGFILLNLARFM